MRINIKGLEKEIKAYLDNRNQNLLHDICESLKPYVYFFPIDVFRDDENATDFYQRFEPNLISIINKFRGVQCSFVTWFSVILRNRYFNLLAEKNGQKATVGKSSETVSLEDNVHFHLTSVSEKKSVYNTNDYNVLIEKMLYSLDIAPRLMFKLKNPAFLFEKDIEDFASFCRIDIVDAKKQISAIRSENIDFVAKIELLSGKIGELNIIISNLEYQLLLCVDDNKKKILQDKLKAKKITLDNSRKKFEKTKYKPTHKRIAGLLGIKYSKYFNDFIKYKSILEKKYSHEFKTLTMEKNEIL